MLSNERNKIIELTSRAISINEVLLNEEKKLRDAASNNVDVELLKRMTEEVYFLMRKEALYIEAAQSYLRKFP